MQGATKDILALLKLQQSLLLKQSTQIIKPDCYIELSMYRYVINLFLDFPLVPQKISGILGRLEPETNVCSF